MREITFPSGRKGVVPDGPATSGMLPLPLPPRPDRQKQTPLPPCDHLGGALKVISGCRGVGMASTWECKLHGVCAPLALADIKQDGVTVCKLCPDHTPAPEPGWIRLGIEFLTAIGRWRKAGKPTRSPERIAQLLKICTACPFLVLRGQPKQHCGKCGCHVNDSPDPMKNILAMGSESCPLDPPLWTADAT